MTSPKPPVLSNAMWRTGSTYLAGRFAASPEYLMFYEPDHEGVSRVQVTEGKIKRRHHDFERLHHPNLGSSFFHAYDMRDPDSGRPLYSLYSATAALKDVYNQASSATVQFLLACDRAAVDSGKRSFFGFCRSGTQHARIDAELAGEAIYLWRDPREQFASYDWPKNDYFIPGTLAQLLLSKKLRKITLRALKSPKIVWAAPVLPLVLKTGVRNTIRFSRVLCHELDQQQCYALFYISWLESMRSGRATASLSFSINQLVENDTLRAKLEDRFGIELTGVRSTSRSVPDFDYAAVEKRIQQALGVTDPLSTAHRQ